MDLIAAFIPAWLDELGLSANEFRVYAHICRRAGNGCCNAGVESMAKTCRLNPKTVKQAIEKLKLEGLIEVEIKPGFANHIRPKYCSNTPPNRIPHPIEHPPQSDTPHPPQSDTPEGNTNKVNSTRKKQNQSRELTLAIDVEPNLPLPFSSDLFKEAWQSWIKHRKQQRRPVTDESKKMVFRKFRDWGEEKSIQAIWQSIESGWQGIFEPKQHLQNQSTNTNQPNKINYAR